MRKVFFVILSLSLIVTPKIKGQVTFTNGLNSLELSGIIAAYYNARFLDASDPNNHINNDITQPLDKKHNGFGLGTARINIYGMYGHRWEYRLEFDLDALGTTNDPSKSDAGNYSPLLNAYMVYKPWKGFRILAGYAKLPYSANNMAYYPNQPYWSRALVCGGDIFSRRDLGITLKQSFYNEHINLYGGIYTGMGEYILTNVTGGNNDSYGKPEYVGRIDFSTKRYDFNNIYDSRNSQKPVFNIGFNGRYTEKYQTIDNLKEYDLKIISGKKTIIGMDASASYRGFSAQFEIHQVIITPTFEDTSRLYGKNTTYFRAGGLFVQANYYNKKIKSGVYARYDNFIPNDLVANNMEQTYTFGYNFFLHGFKSMLRAQYLYRPVKHSANSNLQYTNDELRIGWQYMF